MNVSRMGVGLCKVADLLPGCSWDKAGVNQHSPMRAGWDPAKHCAHCFPAVVEGGRMDAELVAPVSSARGPWPWEPVDENLVLLRVSKLLLLSCVGACLLLAAV